MEEPLRADFDDWYPLAHRRLVAGLLLSCGHLDDAVEAADEAMARAYERWDTVCRLESPQAWVYRVGINILKRRNYRRQLEQRLLRRSAPEKTLPAPSGETWLLLQNLTRRQRTIVALRFAGGLAEREVAEALGISRSTVSSTLAESLRRLRAQLPSESEVDHV